MVKQLLNKNKSMKMDVSDIVESYLNKESLDVQDPIKCFLKMYQQSGNMGYDNRVSMSDLQVGDVIYVKRSFHPLLTLPTLDNKRKVCLCSQEKKKDKSNCTCPTYKMEIKNDKGEMQKFYTEFNGITTIKKNHMQKVLGFLHSHSDYDTLKKHYDVW